MKGAVIIVPNLVPSLGDIREFRKDLLSVYFQGDQFFFTIDRNTPCILDESLRGGSIYGAAYALFSCSIVAPLWTEVLGDLKFGIQNAFSEIM